MVDWLETFDRKFGEHTVIKRLREIKFHGKVEVNFADGEPNTVHINWCVKPYSNITLTEGRKDGETGTESRTVSETARRG